MNLINEYPRLHFPKNEIYVKKKIKHVKLVQIYIDALHFLKVILFLMLAIRSTLRLCIVKPSIIV